MPAFPSTRSQIGFSIIELVIVLVAMGTLTLIVFPRFSPSDQTLPAQADRLARDLRHTQALAMNQGRTLTIEVESSSAYRIAFSGNTVIDPSTLQPYSVALDHNVMITGEDTSFDSLGRPVSLGALLESKRVFTLTGSSRTSSVTLHPITGFISVSP